jgi:PAS domain-containing protein
MPVRHFERRFRLLTLLAVLPGMLAAGSWALGGERPAWQQGLAVGLGILVPLILLGTALRWLRYPLRTLSNQVAAMREGDLSIRARGSGREDVMGELVTELNALCEHLREHRLEGVETAALLRTVMEEISVAVFAFDHEQRLRLVNRAGEQLLGRVAGRMTGRLAAELGLADTLHGDPARVWMMPRPARRSSSQSSGRGTRASSRSRLALIERIGARLLFNSWPITRMSRFHAWRSSSRRVRERSVSTTS